MFVTVSVYGDEYQYTGPGQFDPIVNSNLQAALKLKLEKAYFSKTKKTIESVINVLEKTYQRMSIAGSYAWWDEYGPSAQTPTAFYSTCEKNLGTPSPLECQRAARNFIRSDKPPQISAKKPFYSRAGEFSFDHVETIEWHHAYKIEAEAQSIRLLCNRSESQATNHHPLGCSPRRR